MRCAAWIKKGIISQENASHFYICMKRIVFGKSWSCSGGAVCCYHRSYLKCRFLIRFQMDSVPSKPVCCTVSTAGVHPSMCSKWQHWPRQPGRAEHLAGYQECSAPSIPQQCRDLNGISSCNFIKHVSCSRACKFSNSKSLKIKATVTLSNLSFLLLLFCFYKAHIWGSVLIKKSCEAVGFIFGIPCLISSASYAAQNWSKTWRVHRAFTPSNLQPLPLEWRHRRAWRKEEPILARAVLAGVIFASVHAFLCRVVK